MYLRSEVASLRAERQRIADAIKVHLDDGTAPDNLADHVQLAMQEYDSLADRLELERLRAETAEKQRDELRTENERLKKLLGEARMALVSASREP